MDGLDSTTINTANYIFSPKVPEMKKETPNFLETALPMLKIIMVINKISRVFDMVFARTAHSCDGRRKE